MPRDKYTIGIEIHDAEVRVVQVKKRSNGYAATAAFCEPLQTGAVIGGVVQQPGVVAVALQKAIHKTPHLASSRVVVGLSNSATAARALTFPPCTNDELQPLLRSEVQYQRVLQADGGAYGFFELASGQQQSRQAAVVAIEEGVLNVFSEAVDRSMVDVLALEPSLFGVLRSFEQRHDKKSPALLLSLSAVCAELLFFKEGRPVFFRRIDVGSRSLSQDVEQLSSGFYPRLHALDHLCTEVRRSLDFLEREIPEVGALERVAVAVDEPSLIPLHNFFEEHLGLPVELLRPPADWVGELRYDLVDSPDAVRYTAAFGHALFTSEAIALSCPRVDFRGRFGTPPTLREHIQALATPAILAAAFLMIGGFISTNFNRQAGDLDLQTADITQQAANVRMEADLAMGEQAKRLKQFDVLKREGIPLPAIMDDLAKHVGSGVGLTGLLVDRDQGVHIEGEATSEAAMLQTLESLRSSEVLKNLSVASFGRDVGGQKGLRFMFDGGTLTMGDVRLATSEDTLR